MCIGCAGCAECKISDECETAYGSKDNEQKCIRLPPCGVILLEEYNKALQVTDEQLKYEIAKRVKKEYQNYYSNNHGNVECFDDWLLRKTRGE
jgi:hypothetical protein